MQCNGLPSDVYSDFVLGALAGPDRTELDEHLDGGCLRCKDEIAVARRIWSAVAFATPLVEPGRQLRGRVLALVEKPIAKFRFAWWQPAAGLAGVAAAVVGWEFGSLRNPVLAPSIRTPTVQISASNPGSDISALQDENRALRDRLAHAPLQVSPSVPVLKESDALQELAGLRRSVEQAQAELAQQKSLLASAERARDELNGRLQAALSQPAPDSSGLQRQLVAAQARVSQLEHDVTEYRTLLVRARERQAPVQTASLLADPGLRLVRLRGTAKGSVVEAHALVAGGSQVVFYASQLPALPNGRVYQLWLVRGTAPAVVSAGVFQPNAQGQAEIKFDNSGLTTGVTTLAVTDEPEGGSATPTGHKLLVGS